MPPDPLTARGPGRPQHKPIGAKRRYIDLTEGQFAAVREAARRAGVSAAEWMRRRVIAAAKAPDA